VVALGGEREDASGPVLEAGLRRLGADVAPVEVLPDGIEPLAGRLRALAAEGVRLCLCTGGTGLGPADLAPEALRSVADRVVDGPAETIRSESARRTPMAWPRPADAALVPGIAG